jgi:hypothetical protein
VNRLTLPMFFYCPPFPQCSAVSESFAGMRSHIRATMRIVNFALRSQADGFDKRGLIHEAIC